MTSYINQHLMSGFNGLLLKGAIELISKNSNIMYNLDDDLPIKTKSKILTNIILNDLTPEQIIELNKVLSDIEKEKSSLSQEVKNKISEYMKKANLDFVSSKKKKKTMNIDDITSPVNKISNNNKALLEKVIKGILEEKKENP